MADPKDADTPSDASEQPAETPPAPDAPDASAPAPTPAPGATAPAPGATPDAEGAAAPAPHDHGGGVWNVLKEWWTNAEEGWRFLGGELERKRLYFKVVLVHLRYTFAYLAFGFAVSAPLQLGASHKSGFTVALTKCLLLGGIFALPSLLLYPFTIIDWSRMRIPEFKNLELALTRWAVYLSLGFLALSGILLPVKPTKFAQEGWLYWVCWFCDWRIAWINVVLMFFAWLRVKFHTILFREFYTLKEGDDLVLLKYGRPGSGSDVGEGPDDGERKGRSGRRARRSDSTKTERAPRDADEPEATSDDAKPDAAEAEEPDAKPDDAKPDDDAKPADEPKSSDA